MHAIVTRSPHPAKKLRATLSDGTTVDFGARGMEDYTTHKDARRMSSYLRRHGGLTSKEYANAKRLDTPKLRQSMAQIHQSTKENWRDPRTAGFWSRWLLWSEPTLALAARRVPGVIVTLRGPLPRPHLRRRTSRRSRV